MNIGEFKDGKPQQVLPPSLAEHESELAAFQKSCHDLMLKILTLFGIGLEVPTPVSCAISNMTVLQHPIDF
jgi:isopenicillin N synthase-like dioxygenase